MRTSGETSESSSREGINHGSEQQKSANEQVGVTKRVRSWATSLGTVAAYLALGLSIFNFCQANAEPQVGVYLPKLVRMFAQPKSSVSSPFIGVVIQPTYALLRSTTKTAVIVDVSLELHPPNGTVLAPTYVAWLQNSSLKDIGGPNAQLAYESEPAPIVVNQDQSQAPYLTFAAYGMEGISPGRWTFTLVSRQANGMVLTSRSCIDISPDWAQFINRSAMGSAIVPILRNDLGPANSVNACYIGRF